MIALLKKFQLVSSDKRRYALNNCKQLQLHMYNKRNLKTRWTAINVEWDSKKREWRWPISPRSIQWYSGEVIWKIWMAGDDWTDGSAVLVTHGLMWNKTRRREWNRFLYVAPRNGHVRPPFLVVSLINPECLAWKPLLFVSARADTANFIANWTLRKHAGHLHANPFISLAFLSLLLSPLRLSATGRPPLTGIVHARFCQRNSMSRWKRNPNRIFCNGSHSSHGTNDSFAWICFLFRCTLLKY